MIGFCQGSKGLSPSASYRVPPHSVPLRPGLAEKVSMPLEQSTWSGGSSGMSSLLRPSFPPRDFGLGLLWAQPTDQEQHFLQQSPKSLTPLCLQCLRSCAPSSSLSFQT